MHNNNNDHAVTRIELHSVEQIPDHERDAGPMGVFGALNGTPNAVSSGAHFGVHGRIVGAFLSLLTAIAFFSLRHQAPVRRAGAAGDLPGTCYRSRSQRPPLGPLEDFPGIRPGFP